VLFFEHETLGVLCHLLISLPDGAVDVVADTDGKSDPPVCVEWKCAKMDNTNECIKEYCHRAQTGTLETPTWMTWIKGEIPSRDENCITWHCHQPGIASALCSVFRCTWSSENRKCMEWHPTVTAQKRAVASTASTFKYTSLPIDTSSTPSVEDCQEQCNKVNCTSFHFLPNVMTSKGACGADNWCQSSSQRLTWTDTDGDGVADPLCRESDGTYSARRSSQHCQVAYGATVLQFRSMPTCTLYNTPAFATVASTSMPGSSAMDAHGNAFAEKAPLAGQCYQRKRTVGQKEKQERRKKDTKCFPSVKRRHSETTCRTVVPQIDKYAGVNWHKKGSTGELWNNRDGVDKVYYGPGKNGMNSFDWFGWTIPLVMYMLVLLLQPGSRVALLTCKLCVLCTPRARHME